MDVSYLSLKLRLFILPVYSYSFTCHVIDRAYKYVLRAVVSAGGLHFSAFHYYLYIEFIHMDQLPSHVLEQIEADRRLQEEKRRLEEYERSLCKVCHTHTH